MKNWELLAIGFPIGIIAGLFALRMLLIWDAKRVARKQGFYCYPGFVPKNYAYRQNTRNGGA